MSTTLATIRGDLAEEYGLGKLGAATAAGSATSIVDLTNFGGPQNSDTFPNGSTIRITSGLRAGQKTRKVGLVPSTGAISVDPTLTDALAVADTFIISRDVDSTDRMDEAINRALTRKCSHVVKVPLTSIPDGDFLGTTVTDHWTGVTATPSYATLSMANGVAQRALSVLTSGAGGYAQSDLIPVTPGETRQGYLMMRNAHATPTSASTPQLTLLDATNAVSITPIFTIGAATSTSRSFVNVRFSYVVPATCSQVRWLLGGVENPATVQFGNCMDVGQYQHQFATQPHLLSPLDMGRFYLMSMDSAGSRAQANSFTPFDIDRQSVQNFGWGSGIEFDAAFPMFYDEQIFYPAFSSAATADSETTDCPEELVIAGAAVQLLSQLERQEIKRPELKGLSQWTILLQQAEENWRKLTHLRPQRKVTITRPYRPQVFA